MNAIRTFCMAVALCGILAGTSVHAQGPASAREQARDGTVPSGLDEVILTTNVSPTDASQSAVPQNQDAPRTTTPKDEKSSLPDAPAPAVKQADQTDSSDQYGKQSKRILGIVPNFRSVSANTYLPPMSFKSELWLATQDTFDYSGVIFVGALAGISMAEKSEPQFGQGTEGFGKYYWHTFADSGLENYFTEAFVPVVTREDPRYYTLGHGGLFKRTGYAVSRLLITRTNSGKSTFNLSEVVGAGASSGIGNAYYLNQSNPWVKTYQRWGTQVGLDGLFNVMKEFWPDINQAIFHGKY